jgi:type IV secretion system protein VirD4
LQVCNIIQSLAQFQNWYPDGQWAEIIGNCDTQLMLGCTEEQGAEFFSMRSGDMTVETNSTMTVRKTLAVAQMIPQYRHTEGQGRRRLLTPDEVLRFPNDELMIIIRGHKVLKAKKFDSTGHPYAKLINRTSIFDYNPKRSEPVIQEGAAENVRKAKNALFSQTDSEVDGPEKSSGAQSFYQGGTPPEEF